MTEKKQQAVVYIDTNKLFFFPTAGGAMAQLAFPPEVVSDLEILSVQKLTDLLNTFFQSQKVSSANVLLVFSQAATFEKDFTLEEKENVQHFLDYVPFDDVISKAFPVNKKIRAVAINGQFFTLVREALEKAGCSVLGVVSYSLLTTILPELSQKVDIQLILSHLETCRQFSVITSSQEDTEATPQNKQKEKKQTYLLLGVFGVLLLVLFGMLFFTMRGNTPSRVSQTPVVPKTLPTPTPTIVIIPTTATRSATISLPQASSEAHLARPTAL